VTGGAGTLTGGGGALAEGVALATVVSSGLGLLSGGLDDSEGVGLLSGGLDDSEGLGLPDGPDVPAGLGLADGLGLTAGVGVTDGSGLAEALAHAVGAGLAHGLGIAVGVWQGFGVGPGPGVLLAAPGCVTTGDGCCPCPSTVPPPRPPFSPVWRDCAPVAVPDSVCHPNGVAAKMPIATIRATTPSAAATATCARAHRVAGTSRDSFPAAPGSSRSHIMKLSQPPSASRAAAE
jgi:hypothetical protein